MKQIGKIVGGSYLEGLEIKLNSHDILEDIRIGSILVYEGEKRKYYSILVDQRIEGMNKATLVEMPRSNACELLKYITDNTSIYTIVKAQPMLAFNKDIKKNEPIKNIVSHATEVRKADANDISDIFGKQDNSNRYFPIGSPLDMDESINVCLDIERFIERSIGIYGRTGTGKSFIARLIMAGIILSDMASLLIFDAHSDHGKDSIDELGRKTKGLRSLFGNKIQLMSIDINNITTPNVLPIEIDVEDIEIDDILYVADELNLNETAEQVMIALKNRLPSNRHWLKELLNNGEELIEEFGESEAIVNKKSLEALIRKLEKLKELPYLKYDKKVGTDSIELILNYLQKGISIDIMFGTQNSLLSYLFVTNVITRRIFKKYMEKYEKLIEKNRINELRPLIIAIEEAHRFLSTKVSKQTIFGTIAREMRKAKVNLMCIDQRPSQIDDEIASQIGTRIILSLSDEMDINAALCGMKNSKQLRGIIESLDTKQQALVVGHAVPMPIAIKSKNYNQEFYDYISMQFNTDVSFEENPYKEAERFFEEYDY